MKITISDAEGQLDALVRRVEAGEEIILTRDGLPVARLANEGASVPPSNGRLERENMTRVLEEVSTTDPSNLTESLLEIAKKAQKRIRTNGDPMPGVSAARSQDFLYDDETGLPK